MEDRAPFTGTPPPTLGGADAIRYILGAVVERIMAKPHNGECVYTRKQHEEICRVFHVSMTASTPFFESAAKHAVEQLSGFMADVVACTILHGNAVDLFHIKWGDTTIEPVGGWSRAD